jgi:hypothetical protein
MYRCLVSLLVLALFISLATAQLPKDTFTDPDKAGPDFVVQGEYEGLLDGKEKWSAQVAAEGKGKFQTALLKGGLPGDGWDGKTRVKAVAHTADSRTTLEGEGWKGAITEGKLTAKNDAGHAIELKRVVRKSPTEGLKPPVGAVVLFDGTNVDAWDKGKIVEDKLLAPGTTTRQKFRDFTLHVEFRLPFRPLARGQSRGNSGVYLQQRYEIQILDSFAAVPRNNDCAAIYEKRPPSTNMCYPPLSWQTYDIEFRAARYTGGKKTSNAIVTVKHNGVVVHEKVEIPSQTGFGRREEDAPEAINLQLHGNPVYFRNVWIVPHEDGAK